MFRIGTGYDVHRLATGRRLVLGGVEIPHSHGLEGHSDADVLLHAVADALLGAAALGDLGGHFPSGEPRFAGADSSGLLQTVVEKLREEGWQTVNVDSTLVAEQPRLAPHIPAMRARIAEILGIVQDGVSVKATTTDGLGFSGKKEGIAAQAVVLIQSARDKT